MSSERGADFWSRLAERVVASRIGTEAVQIDRFPTGLSHFVVSVKTPQGDDYVVRIATPERKQELLDGLLWHGRLDDLGVPLPSLHDSGEIDGHHFALYDRLPGEDLENIYSSLEPQSKRKIAVSVAQVQQTVSKLDKAYFGDYPAWPDAVNGILDRSERSISAADDAVRECFDTAREMTKSLTTSLAAVESVAFLYDLNVRNVIVSNGRMSGIIDVDEVWFGDPLLAIGRGKTLLLAMQQETDYIDYWCDYLEASSEMLRMIDLYALLYCVRFMATSGQRLNGNYSIQTDPQNIVALKTAASSIVGALS